MQTIISIPVGQIIGLVFFLGFCFAIAITAFSVRAKNYKHFDVWFEEVVYLSQFYGIKETEIKDVFKEDVWNELFEEGLPPDEAMKKYFRERKIDG